MVDKRYIILKNIDGGWAVVNDFDSAIEATNQQENMTADEGVAAAVYDQQTRTLVSYNIPKGPPLEALLQFAILNQIEANLANKDNPPGIVTL